MYNWVTLLYSRNWHNIVNQLHFNLKKTKQQFLGLLGGARAWVGGGVVEWIWFNEIWRKMWVNLLL